MKKAKLLSLFLAGALLFQTAGIDAMATQANDPVITDTSVEEPTEESDGKTPETSSEEKADPEQPSDSDVGTKDSSKEEADPEQPSDGDTETNNPSKEEADPEQPSDGSKETNDPSEEEADPEQPSDGSEETNDPSEEEVNPEQPSDGGEETNDPSEEELNPEQPSDEETEVPEESIPSEDSISENTVSENTLPEEVEEEEDAFAIFPGLGDGYIMSSQQLADKKKLALYMDDIIAYNSLNADDYPDAEGLYELGEVVYLADTETEAEQVAKAFGGTLNSYSYKVAVIDLPKRATVAMAVAAAANPEIKLPAVWPNYYNYLDSDVNETDAFTASNDPKLANQWQHDYIGTGYAWAAGYKGQGIKVAVIDTGLQMNHEDLTANAATGRNFVDGAKGTEHAVDNQTHGTHVAGIIAADENNEKGGAGIAPDATVRGYCVFPEKGTAEGADILRAINAAVEDGNDIINMSLGSSMYDDNYAKVVQNAYEKGVAIFASSGNSDTDGNNFPASFSGTISVGAVDQNSARAAFSNYGSSVNLSFPGVKIYSTVPTGYGLMNGTSQASPAAAGTAAVILSAREDIRKKTGKARVDALLSAMKSSTTKCTSSGMGAGTTWLPGVLKIATDITAPDMPSITIDDSAYTKDKSGYYISPSINVTLSVKTAVGVELYYSTDGKNPSLKNGVVTNAQLYTGTPITLGGAKKVTVKAVALNPTTGKMSKVASKSFTLVPLPTEVAVASANNVSRIAAGKSLKLTASVIPSYAVSTKVAWSVNDAAKTAGITIDAKGNVKTKAATAAGEYTATATALGSDGKPLAAVKDDFPFTVIAKADIKTVAFKQDGKTYKAPSLNVGDPGHDLKPFLKVTKLDGSAGSAADVVWSSSNTKIATVADGVVTAVAPGSVTIKATSNDGGGKSASCKIKVNQPVVSIKIPSAMKVATGRSITLSAELNDGKAKPTNKKLTWTVTGNDSVTVSATGKVTAKKGASGTCTVTATAKDGSNVSSNPCAITIVSGEITKITLSKTTLTLFSPKAAVKNAANAPTKATLTPSVTGKPGYDRTLLKWTSNAPGIATVDETTGQVIAKSAGKATITCTATDGSNKKATCKVTVSVPMSKLAIGTTDSWGTYFSNGKYVGYIAAGKSIKMSARYSSNYGTPTNKKVTWHSSDENILKVDKNGKVTADKAAVGKTAVITAIAADGSGVTSNEYLFQVNPLYKKVTIEDGFVAIAWDGTDTKTANGFIIPDYYTVTVSGGKNPGLSKYYDASAECYRFAPIPGRVTTQKPSSSTMLYTNELQKMTMTVKLRDGSGLSAKRSLYVARFNDGSIKFFK